MDPARRWFVTRLPLALLVAPCGAEAQPAGKVWRIGLVSVAYMKIEELVQAIPTRSS
jgi:hypothetical protein